MSDYQAVLDASEQVSEAMGRLQNTLRSFDDDRESEIAQVAEEQADEIVFDRDHKKRIEMQGPIMKALDDVLSKRFHPETVSRIMKEVEFVTRIYQEIGR